MLQYYERFTSWTVNGVCERNYVEEVIKEEEEAKNIKQNYSWNEVPDICTLDLRFSYRKARKGLILYVGDSTQYKEWKVPKLAIIKEIVYKKSEPTLNDLANFRVPIAIEYLTQHFKNVQIFLKSE